MTLSIKKPCKHVCKYIEDINRGMKKMSNDKATKIILVTSELFKWTRPQAKQWITIMDQATKQVFQKIDKNWIKPIHKRGDKKLVSNYQTNMAISFVIAKLYSPNTKQKIISWGWASSQTSTCQLKHSTIDQLVTLWIFKETFDIVPTNDLWKRMPGINTRIVASTYCQH